MIAAKPALLLIPMMVMACASKPSGAYQTHSCDTRPRIDVGHKGPSPSHIQLGDYPSGTGSSFVRVTYDIDPNGVPMNIAIVQVAGENPSTRSALEIVRSMRFDSGNLTSESIVSFKPGWLGTCTSKE